MQNTIRILQVTFDLALHPKQIGRWRGAFVEMGGRTEDFFHNHKEDNYFYRYPLIQYRINRGKAMILAINEGVEALQRVLANNKWELNWDGELLPLRIEDLKMREAHFQMLPTPKLYVVEDWLALNDANYKLWNEAPNLIARIRLLEKLLANQLLGVCKALNFQLPERLEVNIQDLRKNRKLTLHGIGRIAFNLQFDANIFLPPGLAFGNGVSHGFGRQYPFRAYSNNESTKENTLLIEHC